MSDCSKLLVLVAGSRDRYGTRGSTVPPHQGMGIRSPVSESLAACSFAVFPSPGIPAFTECRRAERTRKPSSSTATTFRPHWRLTPGLAKVEKLLGHHTGDKVLAIVVF